MAEGLLSGVLGGEDEEKSGSVPLAAQPFAAAIAVDMANHSPEVAAQTAAFLREQTEVLKVQKKSLEAEYEYFEVEWGPRLFGIRLRTAFQLFTALVAMVIGLGLIVLIYDAFSSRSVIVEALDAPPALAARGLSGKVIAGALLDELTRLQAVTRSTSAKRHLSSAWTGDIKVEVPETGVSIGEIDRLLKQRFGHDLHIGGDLVQTDIGGLALTVRGDGVSPKVFTGAAGDLDKLITRAAEYIWGQSEPAMFVEYLSGAGRNAEAVTFSKAAYAAARPADRPYLLNGWANALGSVGGAPRDELALYREALKLKPDLWAAYENIMATLGSLGDEEGEWREGAALRKAAGGRPGRAPELNYENWDAMTYNLLAWRAELLADEASHGGVGTGVFAEGPSIATADALLHDPADAVFQLQTTQNDTKDPSIAATTHYVRGLLAAEAGNGPRALDEMEAFAAANADPEVSTSNPGYACQIAPAEEAGGHPDKADAALMAGGHFVDCWRFKADILDHRGDWVGAQRAYASAVAIAPDLPAGYYSWGAALARHGDLAGALVKLAAAHARGPHWADPLKAWGDVLAREGLWRAALAKYDEALKCAPAWAALRAARGTASSHVAGART